MSRKRSGFAITSVRGGNGDGAEGGNGSASNGSASGPAVSRFRLVRLTAEPLRRGRWVCRDYYERAAECRGGCGRLPASLGSPPPRLFPQAAA
ncbi:T22D4 protein, partial [Tricholaema leucomelas]|nr:T22D4 protein [Tricholaema leucomelas]